jgi:cytoskeletal protein CcmA (bactofilin family)
MTRTIKRTAIASRGHVELHGNFRVSGEVVVGGNLTIHGDLECAGPVLCLGHIDVRGDLTVREMLIAGCGADVAGDLRAGSMILYAGSDDEDDFNRVADGILTWMSKPPKEDDLVLDSREYLADEEVVSWIASHQPHALEVKGDCFCGRLEAAGHVFVSGHFQPDTVDAMGLCVSANSILAEGDVDCGDLDATRGIEIQGNLDCVSVDAKRLKVWGSARVEGALMVTEPDRAETDAGDRYLGWHDIYDAESGHDPLERVAPEQLSPSLEAGSLDVGSVTAAGSIRVEGSIACRHYLRANRSIIAGGVISTGKQHGILAGIGVPRDRWASTGYVSSSQRPQRVLTGVFRPLGRRRAGSVLKPAGLPRIPRKEK